MKLRDLAPGTRFRYPSLGKTATLLSLGPGGARIKYASDARLVRLQDPAGEVVEFEAPGRPVVVSDDSDVEVMA